MVMDILKMMMAMTFATKSVMMALIFCAEGDDDYVDYGDGDDNDVGGSDGDGYLDGDIGDDIGEGGTVL